MVATGNTHGNRRNLAYHVIRDKDVSLFGVLEGSCWGGSDSNLSTANETLFNETVDRSFTVSAGEGSTGVGGLLAVGATPLIGDDISFTRESGVATALVPPDSLSVVLVLTTGNGFWQWKLKTR